MNKVLIVIGTMIVVGFLFGNYVASQQSNEIKPFDYSNYINGNVKESNGKINVTLCDSIYEYSKSNDTVVSVYNVDYKTANKYGFKDVTSKGVMDGLVMLGLAAIPAYRENAYNIMKSDWRYMVAGGVGLGLGFSAGYYIKYKGECDCEHSDFNTFLRTPKNLRAYSQGLDYKRNNQTLVPHNRVYKGVVIDPSKSIVIPR